MYVVEYISKGRLIYLQYQMKHICETLFFEEKNEPTIIYALKSNIRKRTFHNASGILGARNSSAEEENNMFRLSFYMQNLRTNPLQKSRNLLISKSNWTHFSFHLNILTTESFDSGFLRNQTMVKHDSGGFFSRQIASDAIFPPYFDIFTAYKPLVCFVFFSPKHSESDFIQNYRILSVQERSFSTFAQFISCALF